MNSESRRVFDGLDVVQERDENNLVTAQLVRDGNIGGILSRTTSAGASYFHYDGNGNVVALSDEQGALVGRYCYDAFGNTLEATGPRAQENPFRFSTKEVHTASGLVDFGYRFYSPSLSRWINRDPIREDGGINIYGMVGNNPINDVDEYGEAPKSKLPTTRYVLYAKINYLTNQVYIGRSSGPWSRSLAQIVKARDLGHHMNAKGFGPAKPLAECSSYAGIRGLEDRAIRRFGGAISAGGTSGNAIRGIGLTNKKLGTYTKASEDIFGKIARGSKKFHGLFNSIDNLLGKRIAGPFGFIFELIDTRTLLNPMRDRKNDVYAMA